MEENRDNKQNAESVTNDILPTSGYGLVSVIIGAIFFTSMIVFAFNAGIITMTSDTGILETKEIVSILYSFLTSAGPASIIGIAFGIAGFRQKDRGKPLPCAGLILNFINLNGAVLCLVILNIE